MSRCRVCASQKSADIDHGGTEPCSSPMTFATLPKEEEDLTRSAGSTGCRHADAEAEFILEILEILFILSHFPIRAAVIRSRMSGVLRVSVVHFRPLPTFEMHTLMSQVALDPLGSGDPPATIDGLGGGKLSLARWDRMNRVRRKRAALSVVLPGAWGVAFRSRFVFCRGIGFQPVFLGGVQYTGAECQAMTGWKPIPRVPMIHATLAFFLDAGD